MAKFVDVTAPLKLADNLGQLSAELQGQVGIDALNQTIDRTNDLARERMIAGINLSDAYVRGKMRVTHATPQLPQARITAEGTATPLSQYATGLSLKPVNWSNARIQEAGHKFGKWPGWTKRKGLPSSGVPVDTKQVGRQVQVRRGGSSLFPHTFITPGKTDSNGNLLVFVRKPSGKLDTLLGPAVYQLFGYQIKLLADDIGDDLAESLQANIDAAIAAVLA
jgi:hypothetical protein